MSLVRCWWDSRKARRRGATRTHSAIPSRKSPLTQPGEGIADLAEKAAKLADFQNPDSSVTRRAMVLCHLVHEALTYEKGRTGIHTSAEEALSYHAGVCEDYSHVLIALCRHFHLTARYVTGYLVRGGREPRLGGSERQGSLGSPGPHERLQDHDAGGAGRCRARCV